MANFRHVEVRSPFYEVGNVIVDYCEPFVKSLRYPYSGHRCTQCFAERRTSMMTCSICSMAFYCDENCQSKDWDNGHQEECGLFECRELRDFCRESNDFYVCLALRFYVLKSTNHESYRKQYRMYDNSYRGVSSLNANEFGQNMAFRKLGVKLTELLTKADKRKDLREDELYEILTVLEVYKVCLLCNFQEELIGFGIYFELNIFPERHKPTATFLNKGSQLQVRAIAKIHMGLRPTISHLMVLANSEEDYQFHHRIVSDFRDSLFDSHPNMSRLKAVNEEMRELRNRISSQSEWPRVRLLHEKGLKMHRRMLHKYDVRILLWFKLTLFFGAKIGVNKFVLSDILKKTTEHMMVAYGKDHPYYELYVVQLVNYRLINL